MFLTRELLWWLHDNNVATLYSFPLTNKLYIILKEVYFYYKLRSIQNKILFKQAL